MKTSYFTDTLDLLKVRLKVVGASELKSADQQLVREALVMRLALLSDLLVGSSHHDYVVESWRRTILGLKTLDVESYSSDWKTMREIATSIEFRAYYPDPDACLQHFKRAAQSRIHYKWTLNAVLALIGGDADWYWRVNQFIVFDSKLNLDSLDLTYECCEAYLDFEASIPDRGRWRAGDGKADRLLNIARRSAEDLVGSFRITDYPFRPSHGNGATAEVPRSRADSWHKNRQFRVDSEVITYLKYRVPSCEWREWFYVPYRGLNRTAVVKCVPKSLTSNRTISAEPTTLQYLQQDVLRALDEYFVDNLSSRINLHDQTRSRLLAQVGSSDGSYSTIDLSSASDSVTLDLIEALFDGMPILYPLLATRSTSNRVKSKDGRIDCVIQTRKFAPMGSSTCFPVECIVFAVMAEVAIRETRGRASRVGDYVVYGDDIVIRDEYAAALVETLTFFGFDVNVSKSFYGDRTCVLNGREVEPAHFREACGIECLNGEDITPLRLSRRLVSATDNRSTKLAGQGVGLIDLVNRAYLYHYSTLRRVLCTWLSRYKWFRSCMYLAASDYKAFVQSIKDGREPYVRVTAPFIITDDACDTNWRAFQVRYVVQHGIQEHEALVTAVKPRQADLPLERGPQPLRFRSKESKRTQLRKDSNDYFSWVVNVVARNSAEVKYELDATGIATLRTRDLVWSTKWVVLQRPALLCPPDKRY